MINAWEDGVQPPDSAAEPCRTMEAWLANVNTRDAEGFVSYLTDDVTFEDTSSKRISRNKKEVVQYLTDWFTSFIDTRTESVSTTVSGDFGVIEWETTLSMTQPFDGLPEGERGKMCRLRSISRVEFSAGGRVREHRCYWNAADLIGS